LKFLKRIKAFFDKIKGYLAVHAKKVIRADAKIFRSERRKQG
jgi:hypothetical protein